MRDSGIDMQNSLSNAAKPLTFCEKNFAVEADRESSPITVRKKRARPSPSSRRFGKKQKVNLFRAQARETVSDSHSNR